MIVEQFMSKFSQDIEVISFSTYLGDTRIVDKEAPNHVLTTGVKEIVHGIDTFKLNNVSTNLCFS